MPLFYRFLNLICKFELSEEELVVREVRLWFVLSTLLLFSYAAVNTDSLVIRLLLICSIAYDIMDLSKRMYRLLIKKKTK
jgi:hypothetical protein